MAPPTLECFHATADPCGVVTVTIDVPGGKYNVFNQRVLGELDALLAWLESIAAPPETDFPARLVIFRSSKASGFVAGGDLKVIFAIEDQASARRFIAKGQELFERLEALPIPTVAVIHGPCLGGGLEFAMTCRYRVARSDAATRLGLPEVKLGLLPAWGGTQQLPRLVGLEEGLRMLWTGRIISADKALERGLVHAIWPAERFEEELARFVAELLQHRPPAATASIAGADADAISTAARECLLRARQRLQRGRPRPAVRAILSAVEVGIEDGRAAGLARERELFPQLLFGEVARRRLTRFFNRPRSKPNTAGGKSIEPWVAGLTLGAALRETARKFAAREALVFRQSGLRMTWGELDQRVDRVSRGLLALGLTHGDHFGVWSTNWPEWVFLQFAAARVGVVLVTINPSYRAAELSYTLAQSDVRGLALIERHRSSCYFDLLREVCPELDAARAGELQCASLPKLERVVRIRGSAHPGMLAWEDFEAAGERIDAAALAAAEALCKPGDPINLQYTSGTTGLPKGALLSHRNLLMNAFYAAQRQRLTADDRICIPVPLYHCFGCVLGTLCAVASGAAMVFPNESFDAALVIEAIEAEHCTAVYGVPTMFIAELEHASFRERDTSSLRTGIMAGSPCPIELMKRVVREMGASEITIAYGETEASPLITQTATDDPLEKRVGTVGRPLPGIEVRIVDVVSGEELPDGSAGELCARGHDVMLGYYNMPQATAAAIDPGGWLHTGDLALKQPDGYLRITGRLKEMIIRGGENIAPREIEELLYQHPKVEQASVVGVPDAKFGEEVLAWIKLKAGETATVDEIREFCRARLAHFKSPRYVKFVEGFPCTVTGKIQKYRIRQQAVEELGLDAAAAIETA